MAKLSHHKISQEQWNVFPRKTQFLNIASELARVCHQQLSAGNPNETRKAFERALELIDLTLQDQKQGDARMLYRLRDSLASLYLNKTDPAIINFFYHWLVKTSENL